MTLLVKNGLVYGGGEAEPRKTDVFIRGSKIIRLGNFSRGAADRILDAQGAVVLPGFIDVGSDFDHYFGPFSREIQKKFIERGITTIIGGNFGISLAPFDRDFFGFFYRPGDCSEGNVDWSSVGELVRTVHRQRKLINFGTMLGYANAKSFFTHGKARDLTDRERFSFARVVAKSLREGAFGVSFDFEYPFSRGMPYLDLTLISREVARARGVLSAHFARDGEICRQAEFLLKVARETGVNLEISSLESVYGIDEDGCDKVSSLLDAHMAHVNAGFDLTLFRVSVFPVFYFLPPRLSSVSFKEMADVLDSGRVDNELVTEFKKIKPEKITIGYVPSHLGILRGKTLKEFAVTRKIPLERALLEFLKLSKLRSVVSYSGENSKDFCSLLKKPNALISTGNFVASGLDSKGVFGISQIKKVGEECGMSFGSVLSRMTELPAQKFGVSGRGFVREGYYADLVIARGNDIDQVVVNGQTVFDRGKFTDSGPGKILIH